MNYRKIWTKYHGDIPKDENGRTYEIHHIDGDRTNNSIENLVCISAAEHLQLHKNQGDYYAAKMIAERLNRDIREEMDMPEHRRKEISERMKGDKNPMKRPEVKAKVAKALRGRKKSPEAEAKRLKSREGFTHSEETKQKMRKPKSKLKCPYCYKIGGVSQMKRWHMDNCKSK